MASSDDLVHRVLTAADIPAALALSTEAGWNQTADDWRLMIENGIGFAMTSPNQRLVATALAHGRSRFGWISMVLVTPDERRRGLASGLLQRCIAALQARAMVPGLDATEAGRKVYGPIGFRAVYGLNRWSAASMSARTRTEGSARPMVPADLARICEHDVSVSGLDRSYILHGLFDRAPSLAAISERGGHVQGFVLGRDGREATQIGPLVAADEATAIELAEAALGAVMGRVYIDALEQHHGFNAHLARRGLSVQRGFTRMLLGRTESFDDPRRIFAIAGPELG